MSSLIRRVSVTGVALALGAVSLAGCGSSDNTSSGNGSGSSGGTKITAACKLDNPPTSGAQAPPSGGATGKASGKVGVILPDTTSSTRYTLYDAPLLTKALKGAGITPDVQNAQGDKNKFASIAQNMIGEGAKVLIIDSIDAASGAGVEKEAAKAGVKVIDYDRVNLGGTAGYYVSFDNEDVGKLQAQTLMDCLDANKVDKPKIIMMDGGTDVDNNAVLFKKGAHEVLDPLVSSGKVSIEQEAVVKGWKVDNAAPAFTQALTASGGQVDGVLAANDDIANAVIGVLKNQGLDGHVVVTGQDAGVEGLQNIVTGHAEHDDLQERQARGQRGRPARHRADQRQRPVLGGTDAEPVRRPAGPGPQAPGAAPARAGDHPGERPGRRGRGCAHSRRRSARASSGRLRRDQLILN